MLHRFKDKEPMEVGTMQLEMVTTDLCPCLDGDCIIIGHAVVNFPSVLTTVDRFI